MTWIILGFWHSPILCDSVVLDLMFVVWKELYLVKGWVCGLHSPYFPGIIAMWDQLSFALNLSNVIDLLRLTLTLNFY